MHAQDIIQTIQLKKPAETVFNCIKEIAKWWSKDFEGSSSSLGDEFIICHPGRHYSKQKLVEDIPNKRLVWLITESELNWLEKDKDEWTNTKLIFELSTAGDKTILHFTHQGLNPSKACFGRCSEGWNMVIKERLFSYIMEGKEI